MRRRAGKWQCGEQLQALLILVYPVIELGAGCALPSLLLRTLSEPPSLIVVTDYPDEGISGNLKRNVEKPRLGRCDKRLRSSIIYMRTSREPMLRIICKIISPVVSVLSLTKFPTPY